MQNVAAFLIKIQTFDLHITTKGDHRGNPERDHSVTYGGHDTTNINWI